MKMNAPNPIPVKKARILPLPEWYLPKGIINASNQELEGASSSCERWGIGFAAIVVVAVIAELVIAWVEPPYLLFLTESAVADAVIAIGIAGEVLLGTIWNNRVQTELRRRSNEQLASAIRSAGDANERAAEANQKAKEAELALVELEERLAPRGMTQKGQEFIASRIASFTGVWGEIGCSPLEAESMRLESALRAALSMGGWNIGRGTPTHTPLLPGGIMIGATPDVATMSAGIALAEALIELGLLTMIVPMLDGQPRIFVTIGPKPDSVDDHFFETAKLAIDSFKRRLAGTFPEVE